MAAMAATFTPAVCVRADQLSSVHIIARISTSFSFSIVRSFCIMSIFVLAFSWLRFEYIHMLILSRHGGASTVKIIFLLVSRARDTPISRVSDERADHIYFSRCRIILWRGEGAIQTRARRVDWTG